MFTQISESPSCKLTLVVGVGARNLARYADPDIHIRCRLALLWLEISSWADIPSQRGHKKSVSSFSAFFIAITSIGIAVCAVVAGFGGLAWLDVLYYFSYLKLVISFLKFVPQAWMNYKRKSTIGWSIHNIILVG